MSKLILVPTPIGNLKDITLRALDVLKEVDVILAEDTRKSKILLQHYQLQTKLEPFHKFNEHKVLQRIIERLKSGIQMAMISDAGTPGISDPGFLLVRACVQNEISVETLPGPTSFIPALVNSGLPCDRFIFEGFLPQKKGRNKRLELLATEERTIVLFESPFRLIKTLKQLSEYFGSNRKICVSRELTKIYEENMRGEIEDVIQFYTDKKEVKGEIVIIIEGLQ